MCFSLEKAKHTVQQISKLKHIHKKALRTSITQEQTLHLDKYLSAKNLVKQVVDKVRRDL